MALFAFNVGVEAGQIAIVLTAFTLLAGLRRFAVVAARPLIRASAYLIGIVAGIWFVERLLG